MRLRRTAARALPAAGLLVVLLVAVPVLLIAISRREFGSAFPLAGVPPPWGWELDVIRAAAAEPMADRAVADLLIRISLVTIWLAVVVIVATTAAEVVHMVRHHGIARPSIRGLGWAQPIARVIATGLIVLVPLHTPRVSLASAIGQPTGYEAPIPSLTAPDVGSHADPAVGSPSGDARAPADAVHVVRRGESVYSIAADLAGRDQRRTVGIAEAVLDVNLGRTMPGGARFTNPAYIEVGWRLTIPGHLARDRSPGVGSGQPAVHVVEKGDTLSEIAHTHLGDPDAWTDLWAANAGADMGGGRTFDDPDLILPGWSIEIPPIGDAPGGTVPGSNGSDPVESGEHSEPDAAQPTAPTDADTPVPTPSDTTTADTTTPATTTADDDTTPDTTTPDDSTPATTPRATTPATTTPDDSTPATNTPPTTTPATTTPAATTPADSDPTRATADGSPAGASTGSGGGATTHPAPISVAGTTTVAPVPGGDGDGSAGPTEGPDAPRPIRLEHAAMLAAGVLALLGVRRRRRLRAALPRARVPEPKVSAATLERRLRLVDPGERAERADVAVRAAASSLVGTGVQIGLVFVGTDGGIAVHLTGEAALPAPWTGGPTSWELPASTPIELLGEAARLVGTPCVALAQLGVLDDGRDVMIDLEACPVLRVVGPPELTDPVVAGLTSAVASSPQAEVAHLVGVSVPEAALLGHRNAQRAASADEALELAASLVGTRKDGRDSSSFALRSVRTGGESWEPAVVCLLAADVEDGGIDIETGLVPGGGIAVVVGVGAGDNLDQHPGASGRLRIDGDGWRFDGFGTTIALRPVGMSAAELSEVSELLDTAAAPLDRVDTGPLDGTPDGARPGESASEPFEAEPHQIVVGLMGEVRVTDVDGRSGSFERSKTVELIAWLTTHRERSTRTAARTALWELDVRDATFANVVSEARRALARLVPPPDGEEWLARTLNEQLPLHELVVTDAQLIEQRLAASRLQPPAQAIDTLRPAVEMVRDVPFAGTSYLWPDAEGLTSSLVLLAISAAGELAGHALSVGDIESVFWATGRGLVVLPGHEELIALRMRAHARAGDLAGVRQEWESYERVIVADTWSDGEPAPKLLALRRELLS